MLGDDRSLKGLKELKVDFLEFYGDFIDAGDIISNLEAPWELGYNQKLVGDATSVRGPVIDSALGVGCVVEDYKDFLKFAHGVRFRRAAFNNLPWNSVGPDMLRDWRYGWPLTQIFYRNFSGVYSLLEQLYLVKVNRRIGCEDLLNIYFGGLDERLVFFLDEFDTVGDEYIPEPDKEFFKALRMVKCRDTILKRMVISLENLIKVSLMNAFENCEMYSWKERNVIKAFIYSSAVADNRTEIIADDVIRDYNTYFKLLSSDVTKYTCREDVFKDTNYNSLKSKFVHYSLRLGITHG